ncbi:MAG: GWxTD domain-containing protein, partial [Candidatus Aminicenantes bacterium]
MRKNTIRFLCVFFLFTPCLIFAQKKTKESDLPPRYVQFLNMTRYIIHDQEREVFLKLTADRDRDIFIQTFWKQRDPTPGTPQNEYRDMVVERFNYANKRFKYGTPRPGWMTDMGRFYIILGEPVSKEQFFGTPGIHPTEVWYYYGDSSIGLPPHFALVFFRRGGMGEWKLYDPLADGPHRLLEQSIDIDPTNYEDLYEKIKELAPTLSLVSHSMVPGDIPFNFQPAPINNIYMANILESPLKNVNPKYATHFLDLMGMVDVEYMTNMIDSDSHVSLIRDPMTDLDFLHFSIAPKTISVDYYEPNDQYFSSFKVSVSLRKEEDVIFQYTKDFPFYFAPDDLDRIQANGVAIEDSFPLIAGHYQLIVL